MDHVKALKKVVRRTMLLGVFLSGCSFYAVLNTTNDWIVMVFGFLGFFTCVGSGLIASEMIEADFMEEVNDEIDDFNSAEYDFEDEIPQRKLEVITLNPREEK